jgi:hypothetical protein
MRRFSDSDVASVFKAYPPGIRAKLMALRELVFDTAAGTAGVGRLTETLKRYGPATSPKRGQRHDSGIDR